MKKKTIASLLLAASCTFACSLFTACNTGTTSSDDASSSDTSSGTVNNGENWNGTIASPDAMKVELNEENGVLSFDEVVGAASYSVDVCEYQGGTPVTYTSATNSYTFAKLVAGEYRITVHALDASGEEIGSGSLSLRLEKNIGMPQAPANLAVKNGTLTWDAESTSVTYTVEAWKSGEVKATQANVTACSLDMSSLELGAGIYTIKVYGKTEQGVDGTAGTLRYVVYGESAFGKETSEGSGEYYLADFRLEDDRAFIENDGAKVITDDTTKTGLAYTDASWYNVGVFYELPEAIDWNTVYQIKISTRVTKANEELEAKGAYAYLFDENGKFNGIYPGEAWAGNGTESVKKQDDGWVLTTFSAENIRLRGINYSNTYDWFWKYGEAEQLTKILFSGTGENALVEVAYITYTLRDEATGLNVLYDGEELATEYTTATKFDWNLLSSVGDGDYVTEYRLEKDGVKVAFENEQYLAAGDYTLTSIVRGKYYGKVVKSFTVTQADATKPSGVSGLRYDETAKTLSWREANGAAKYRITAKRSDGSFVEDFKQEVTTTECIVTLPAGRINVVVTAISADGVEGRAVLLPLLSLGDTQFCTEKNPDDPVCDCINVATFDKKGYAAFFTATDYEKITYTENKGVTITDNVNNKASATIEFPTPLDVADKDFEISFAFADATSSLKFRIYLYDENGKDAYCYTDGGYVEGGGVIGAKKGDYYVVTVSAKKIAKNNYYCFWKNAKANKITKIRIEQDVPVMTLHSIEMSIESEGITFVSNTSADTLGYIGGTVIADFGANTHACVSPYIKDGACYFGGTFEYTLPEAIALDKTKTEIVVRYKGTSIISLIDSDGKYIFYKDKTEGKENIYNYSDGRIDIANQSWGGGINVTAKMDGEWKILTVNASKLVGDNVKKLAFASNGNFVLDYIVAVPHVEEEKLDILSGGDASSLGYANGVIIADFGKNSTDTTRNPYIEDGHLVLKQDAQEITFSSVALDSDKLECIKIRFKGNTGFFDLCSGNNHLFNGGVSWNRKYVGYSYGLQVTDTTNITLENDSEGYHVITISKAAIQNYAVDKVCFIIDANLTCKLDYIVAVYSDTVSE